MKRVGWDKRSDHLPFLFCFCRQCNSANRWSPLPAYYGSLQGICPSFIQPSQLPLIKILHLHLLPYTCLFQASYGVEDPEYAVTQLAQTTMRSELGKLSLDKVFRVSTSGPEGLGAHSLPCQIFSGDEDSPGTFPV